MRVDILSDKFYTLSEEQSVFEQRAYEHEVYISTWDNQDETERNSDVLVLDLDFSDYTNEDVIPVLQSGRTVIGSRFEGLRDAIAAFLEGGGIVVVLMSERTNVAFHDSPDSLGWLDHLGATKLLKHENPRQSFEIVSTAPEVASYFDYVDWYRFAIRFEERVVTNPEILAQHSLDNEPLAVAVNEYLDPNGIQRKTNGRVVLLPQPTNIENDFDEFLDALCGIGEHYTNRRNTANALEQLDSISTEDILEAGETEIIGSVEILFFRQILT